MTTADQKEIDWEGFVLPLMQLVAKHGYCGAIDWLCDGECAPISFFVNCNDLFYWATSDEEAVTPENFPVLVQAFRDATEANSVSGGIWAPSLFACRVRGMRPQRAAYPKNNAALVSLFDDCGPERAPGEEG